MAELRSSGSNQLKALSEDLLADDGAAQEPTPAAEDNKSDQPRRAGTSVLGAAMILSTFSTTSSNVMYPFCYGTLGYVLGPVMGLVVQGLMCMLSLRFMDVALAAKCQSVSDLGHVLGGVWGARFLAFLQVMNNALFLPVSLVIASGALQEVVLSSLGCSDDGTHDDAACAWWRCNIDPLFITCVLAWPLLLFARNFGHMTGLAAVSIAIVFAQTGMIIWYAANHAFDGATGEAVLPVGSHAPWHAFISAISVYLYSFVPMFVAVEISAGMANPEGIRSAIVIAYLVPAIGVYAPTGVAVALLWGPGVPNPVTHALGTGTVSAVTNGMLLYSTLLDFVVAATPVNGVVQRCLFPAFDGRLTTGNFPRWLLITLPSLLCALVLAIFVPRLDSLIGLLTFFCVPAMMFFAPSSMMLRHLWYPKLRTYDAEQAAADSPPEMPAEIARIAKGSVALLVVGIMLGALLVPTVLIETIYGITVLTIDGAYWCSAVGS